MTKNKAMRLGSVMLVLALLTTCAISGTFAKYVTSASADQTARVAKWGVTITPDTTNSGFLAQYAVTDGGNYDDDTTLAAKFINSVASSDSSDATTGTKVLAPGTSGDIFKATLTGTPEVLTKIEYTDVDVTLSNWEVDTDGNSTTDPVFSFPVTIKVGGNPVTIAAGSDATAAAEAIETAIKGSPAYYAANTDLSTATLPSVSWDWTFSSSDDADEIDTLLGDAAAGSNAPSITIKFNVKVSQVD